jgi:protein arginine kinase activator
MGVKCDHCDREATVHEVLVKNGKLTERHLCEVHAAQLGVMGAGGEGPNVTQPTASSTVKSTSDPECPSCGTTFSAFRKHGLLGCPDCYATFEDRLTPLLKRAHEGADQHTGRVPARAGSSEQKRAALLQLRRELTEALNVEAYERAAGLRDQIAKLETTPLVTDDPMRQAVADTPAEPDADTP